MTKSLRFILHPISLFAVLASLLVACAPRAPEDINIGFIGPLSGNAVDLGLAPSKAIALAVKEYNANREPGEPKVNFYYEDDGWSGDNAIPLYDKLREEHQIDLLLMSHTDGTVALQDKVLADGVILINSLNNDELLASMNRNTFVVGKKTEEAARVVAARVEELGKKNVGGFYVTNSFMTISAEAFSGHLENHGIAVKLHPVDITKTDFVAALNEFKATGCDALAFFGYKNLGFAMKQARELGMDVSYFASTTTLGDGYYENAAGSMDGTEFSFFTENDGNYIVAREFLERYRLEYGEEPFSVWPPMQAFDAANMVLSIVKKGDRIEGEAFDNWMRRSLLKVNYYQGVCGNIAITGDGSSRGIYFSLYVVRGDGSIEKVRR